MTLSLLNLVVFLVGLFGVPIALLSYGHRLRKRGARTQRVFWGALLGHCVAGVLAVAWGMIPPEAWASDETARGLAGIWGMVLLPALGGLAGLFVGNSRPRRAAA